MIPDIKELNFPKKDGKQYATLTHAEVKHEDMGERGITTQVRIEGGISPDFSYDWAVEFQGEKYIMPLRIPQGQTGDTLDATIDLTFQHWAVYQLKRWPFTTIQQIAAGTYLSDKEVASVRLNLGDFCGLCGQVLEYYYGERISIDLNEDWEYDPEPTSISISHTKIWNVFTDAFHDKYGVRWEIGAAPDNSNTAEGGERYVVRVGYPTTEVAHIFECGFEGGLMRLERQVQSEEIRNMLKGRGGETNIPFCYFKDTDPNNPDFRPDPDWVEELANIYFPNLMGATFRSYVQGWKAAHISKYPGYTAVGENNSYAPWAYRKGYTDTKFSPVEFVADEITVSPTAQDREVEILPGYSPYVKKGSSLDRYGPLPDTLENDDDIYPTLQGTGLDIAVAVEQIESDDVEGSAENDSQIEDSSFLPITVARAASGWGTASRQSGYPRFDGYTRFNVPAGKAANIRGTAGKAAYRGSDHEDMSHLITDLTYTVRVFNATTGEERSASGIPEGSWYFTVDFSFNNTAEEPLDVTCSFNSVRIESATPGDKWVNTFEIWIKNIWGTSKLQGETDAQYSERVWLPILGDREGKSGKVMFTTGALAHEDYEFTIVDLPEFDASRIHTDGEGVAHNSHWRVKLAKSEAELEATGLYVPSTRKQGSAGDRFVFIGTEMTHVPYVVDAEIRLDDGKKDQLGEKKEIKPTYVVKTDRVRLNGEGKPDALIRQLRVGNSIRLADGSLIRPLEGRGYETLYLQSITYSYREPTSEDAALNPDVEITLGNEYAVTANPVSMMQGELSALRRQVGSISNIEQIVRAVCDRLYLRKDGIEDRSMSPTRFLSLLTSVGFRSGMIGGAGWGFYRDENGNWVLETDRINVRQEMQVNNLVINQVSARGGMEIDTAAFMECIRVDETSTEYICYFDRKEGSVANLFSVGDVAYCHRWSAENAELKFYRRRVTEVGADYIAVTKARNGADRPAGWPDSGVNGSGIPAEGDNIIHFGNYTDKTRQYVKVRDVVGGGYECFLDGLDSVNSTGEEYYFAGKKEGEGFRLLIGKETGEFLEWKEGHLNVRGSISINSTVTESGESLKDYIAENSTNYTEEYSVDGEGGWHPVYADGDLYVRKSWDGGETWQDPLPIGGPEGAAAKSVKLTADSMVFSYPERGVADSSATPSSINVTCQLQNTSGTEWSVLGKGMDSWLTIPRYKDKTSIVVLSAATQFGDGDWLRVRCESGGVSDEMTLWKIYGGSDAYTVILSNESHVFGGGTDSAVAGNAITKVSVYKGSELIDATVSETTGLPEGMTRLITASKPEPTILFMVAEGMTAESGEVGIVIEADGRRFLKMFSWSVARRGQTGRWLKTQWGKSTSASARPSQWYDRPMTVAAGEYVWQRSGWVEPPATVPTVWETPVRLTGDQGIAGGDVYLLDLDRESAVVAVSQSQAGNVSVSLSGISTELRVFKGGAKDSGWSFQKTDSGTQSDITTDSDGKVTLTVNRLTAATGIIQITASKTGCPTLTATFTVTKVVNGAAGTSPTIYTLEPSVSVIGQDLGGAFIPLTIFCDLYRQIGTSRTKLTATPSGMNLSVRMLKEDGTVYGQSVTPGAVVTIPSYTTAAVFEINNVSGGAVMARERVPVVPDSVSYMSEFVNTAQELTSIKTAQSSLETSVSAISQKADSIELTVDEIPGAANLFDNSEDDGVLRAWTTGSCAENGTPAGSAWSDLFLNDTNTLRYGPLIRLGSSRGFIFHCQQKARLFLCYFDENNRYLGKYQGWIDGDDSAFHIKTFTVPNTVQVTETGSGGGTVTTSKRVAAIGCVLRYYSLPTSLAMLKAAPPALEEGSTAHFVYSQGGSGLKGSGIYVASNMIRLKSEIVEVEGNLGLTGVMYRRMTIVNVADIAYYTSNGFTFDFRKLNTMYVCLKGTTANNVIFLVPKSLDEAGELIGQTLLVRNESSVSVGISTQISFTLAPGKIVAMTAKIGESSGKAAVLWDHEIFTI